MSEPEVLTEITEYRVALFPEDPEDPEYWYWDLYVRRMGGPDSWGVYLGERRCCSRKGTWDFEPRPSERHERWTREHRFPLEEALALARKEAPRVTVSGLSALDRFTNRRDRAGAPERGAVVAGTDPPEGAPL